MATTITATQVIADWGAYAKDQGQDASNLHTRLFEPFGTKEAFTMIETDDTVLRESNVTFGEVIQGFQTTFTPKGSVTFVPKEIHLYNMKVDQAFYPDALKNSWLSFLTSKSLDRTTWPFVRWFVEVYVFNHILKDLETKAVYGGKYVAPTSGTANNAADTMEGIERIINVANAASELTLIATGNPTPLTNVQWCTAVETFCKGIPELYWTIPLVINMSMSLALKYREGKKEKYGLMNVPASDLNSVDQFDWISIKGRHSMIGKTKIWATPKMNAIMGVKGFANLNNIEIEKVDRQVKVYTDFYCGIGFIDSGLIWTNDRELVVS